MLWSIALGSIAFAAIAATVFLWVLPKVRARADVKMKGPLLTEENVRIASRFPSPSEDEAIRLVKRTIANRDPLKIASLCRLGSATPIEAVDFFKATESRDGAVDRYVWLSSLDSDGLLLEGVQVVFKGTGKNHERLALLTPDEKGVWRVDFDAFARTVKPGWKEILNSGADRAIARVVVGRDSYFNGIYTDEKQWVCYGIGSPDMEELLRGYCRVGSPESVAIEEMLAYGVKMSRATLEIHRATGADSRQFEITRVLAKDWVVADQDVTKNLDAAKSGASY